MVQTYSVTSEPSAEPVAMSVLKARLRVTASEFDDEIASLLEASRRMVEAETSRCFVTQTLKFTADAFPSARSLELRRLPVASVSSVQYVDTSRATQTLSADAYTLDLSSSLAGYLVGLPPSRHRDFCCGCSSCRRVPGRCPGDRGAGSVAVRHAAA